MVDTRFRLLEIWSTRRAHLVTDTDSSDHVGYSGWTTTDNLAIAKGCFERRDLKRTCLPPNPGRKRRKDISDRHAEALKPCQSSSSTSELGRPTRDHLFTMLSVTLVRLDFAVLELLTSDHPTLCQDTKISFSNRRRRFIYL